MTLPPALDPALTEQLRRLTAPDLPTDSPTNATLETVRGPAVRRVAVRTLRTRGGRRVAALARELARRLLAPELAFAQRTAQELDQLREQVGAVTDQRLAEAVFSGRVESNRVNLELLKAEVRSLERILQELGMAFAPATGLEGVAERFSELREQVNALARRVRQIESGVLARTADAAAAGSPSGPPGPRAGLDELFDYVAFERRFRGEPEAVLAAQQERYLDLLVGHSPVVDLGCGRGELAELLVSHGMEVIGVEPDVGMAAEARARGLDVRVCDAESFLRDARSGSIGAIFNAHVAEHMPFEDLLRIVHLSLDRLAPGGIFIAETPNPASLIVPGNSFILDPTHVRPIHPSLFAFVCETAGFRDVRLHFFEPATGYFLRGAGEGQRSSLAEVVDDHATRLNEVLFGPQEYAVVARKAG